MSKKSFTVATLNVNGVRSGLSKGLADWLNKNKIDVLCLQEIKTQAKDLTTWNEAFSGWHTHWCTAQKPGYAGVAIISKEKPKSIKDKFNDKLFDNEGRWIEANFSNGIKVVSVYLPSGSAGAARQKIKIKCMDLMYKHLAKINNKKEKIIFAGDFNIAHTKQDIKNWQNNQKKSGFLPEERQWFTDVLDKQGWVDAFRHKDKSDDKYSWWSLRTAARKRNVGWRIDYQVISPNLAKNIDKVWIDTGPVLSDHAPVIIKYNI